MLLHLTTFVLASAPAPTTPPGRVVIVENIPQDKAEQILVWITGLGTLAAAVGAFVAAGLALHIAKRDREQAVTIAKEDRDQAAAISKRDRDHADRAADTRWRLDLL